MEFRFKLREAESRVHPLNQAIPLFIMSTLTFLLLTVMIQDGTGFFLPLGQRKSIVFKNGHGQWGIQSVSKV